MSVSLKGCKFEYIELSIHFESFNAKCAIVKEAQDANLLSQESKLTRVYLQLIWCPSNRPPCLKTDTFSTPKSKYKTKNSLRHATSWSEYDMQ